MWASRAKFGGKVHGKGGPRAQRGDLGNSIADRILGLIREDHAGLLEVHVHLGARGCTVLGLRVHRQEARESEEKP